jgi:DNA polymerase III subunit delta
MSAEAIITEWKKGVFKPVYWLEGEEDYFIDKVVDYAETSILTEGEAGFNLSVFYGKDADWAEVFNACRRYPMFGERQVVILKEAQQMREVARLEAYISNPLPSTVFVVSYKEKKVDGRSKLAKLLKEKGVLLSTRKLYENQLPEWTQHIVQNKGLSITPKALALLVDHIGNDLSRIENEVQKLSLNLENRKSITEDDIEKYIGVSKDYNIFELQSALAARDLAKSLRIVQYFAANPKAAPIQLVLPSLYGFFNKVFMIFGSSTTDEKTIAASVGINPFFAKDYIRAATTYSLAGTEKALLLLHEYNLRSIGIHDAGTEDASLLKEMIIRLLSRE